MQRSAGNRAVSGLLAGQPTGIPIVQRHADADEPEYVQTWTNNRGSVRPVQRALDSKQAQLLSTVMSENKDLSKSIEWAFNGMFMQTSRSTAIKAADRGELDTALTAQGMPTFGDLPKTPGGYNHFAAIAMVKNAFGANRPAAGDLAWGTASLPGHWRQNVAYLRNNDQLYQYWLENLADAAQMDTWLALLPDNELEGELRRAKGFLSTDRIKVLTKAAMDETTRGGISAGRKEMLQSFGAHGVHLDPEMNEIIRNALMEVVGQLPEAHVKGNPMLTDIKQGKDLASTFNPAKGRMKINVPSWMSTWLYSKLGKSKLLEFIYHLTNPDNKGKGSRRKRSTFGIYDWRKSKDTADPLGRSDSLMKWSIRHEFGHSVDAMLGFENSPKIRDNAFGQWVAYADADAAARALLQDAAVSAQSGVLNAFTKVMAGEGPRTELMKKLKRLPRPADWNKVLIAAKAAEVGLTRPYQFRDGGGQVLNGDRIYHQDYHGDWYSYSNATRDKTKLSNYQWTNPAEWFAESYAAYYDPKPAVKHALDRTVATWFKDNIDTDNPSL